MLALHCATGWIAPRLAFRFMPKINSAAINLGMPHSLTVWSSRQMTLGVVMTPRKGGRPVLNQDN
jgi:hypothetical protein